MIRIKLAILDSSEQYIEKMTGVFSAHFSNQLEIYTFTDEKAAIEAIVPNKIDVLLADEGFNIDVKLIPKRCAFAYLTESNSIETYLGRHAICKYQRAELIYKEILAIFSELNPDIIGYKNDESRIVSVLTFLSGSGGVGGSTMAAACAVSLAQLGRKVLYLNLECFGDAFAFFTGDGPFDLSDVLYDIKSKKSNLALKLESNVRRDNSGVFFFASCKSPIDMLDLKKADIENLLNQLSSTSAYDDIIIDADTVIDDLLLYLFKSSKNIVVVTDGIPASNIKLQRFGAAVEIIEQQNDESYSARFCLLLNNYNSRSSKSIDGIDWNLLGGIPRYEAATTPQQVIEQVVRSTTVFNALINS